MNEPFDLGGPLLEGIFAIEASAGTGKTHSLTGLVARHVAERGLRADQLLMVTFMRSSTADMRDRTRQQCRAVLEALTIGAAGRTHDEVDGWILSCLTEDDQENAKRATHLRSFLARFDEATITTIHGFCQLVLNRAGLASPAFGNVTLETDGDSIVDQVLADVLVGPLASIPDLLSTSHSGTDRSVKTAVTELKKVVKSALQNRSAQRIPRVAAPTPGGDLETLDPPNRWSTIVDNVLRIIGDRRRQAGVFDYDDLVHSVATMLVGASGERIVQGLRDQYRLVLIDEFQDTDLDQWTIFDRAFVGSSESRERGELSLGVVGDPKQAIFRFRGADIGAYRRAMSTIDQRVDLLTNYRSNVRLIGALNALLQGVTFGDPTIDYKAVTARPDSASEGVTDHAPLEIRCLPYSVDAGSSIRKSNLTKSETAQYEAGTLDKWNTNSNRAIDLIYADMVRQIADLISSGRITDKSRQDEPIRPSDIAVLVRANNHAEEVRSVLSAGGIPCVRYRASSVFDSSAALEWRIFLSALSSPSRLDRVRAAALSAFGRSRVEAMLGDADQGLESWQRMCAELSADVSRLGLASVYFKLRSDSAFMTRVMRENESERLLTDLDHIAEILVARPELARGAGPAEYLHALERLIDEAGDQEQYQRRIETDVDAVQIATIHHSKGLEYPIVFLPTLMKMFPGDEVPFVFPSNAQRVVDVASSLDWDWTDGQYPSRNDRRVACENDSMGDLMRMLYVALTRAEQRIVMYWSPLKNAQRSTIGRVLFAPRGPTGPEIDPSSGVPVMGEVPQSNAEMWQVLRDTAERSPDIALVEVSPMAGAIASVARRDTNAEMDIAVFDRSESIRRPNWGKWSYSGIASNLGTVHPTLAEPFRPGADEGQGRGGPRRSPVNSDGQVLFPDALAGADFGSRIHAILEAIDPAAPELEESIAEQVERRFTVVTDPNLRAQIIRAISAVCSTPLGPMFDGRNLSEISRRDRLAEVVFDMKVSDSPVTLARVGQLLHDHLDSTHPFAEYGISLVRRAGRLRLAGFLYGEIDAVFRLGRADGSWSAVIADYKTNLLHQSGATSVLEAYQRDNLCRVMAEDHYVLQALIYQVALHRYLRWRVPEYQPGTHLGGIAYLFIRGLVGRSTPTDDGGEPTGLFTWRPPVSLIEALDAELSA